MIREQINEAYKSAMKGKEADRVRTLRLINAALKDRDIAARSKGVEDGIPDEDVLGMLQSMIKQRQESIRMYEEGGRLELAEQERTEIEVISQFLPKQMDQDELRGAVQKVIAEVGADCIKDMGKCMAALKSQYTGRMDFAKASNLVKERLAS